MAGVINSLGGVTRRSPVLCKGDLLFERVRELFIQASSLSAISIQVAIHTLYKLAMTLEQRSANVFAEMSILIRHGFIFRHPT